jgi:hypothetical protein
MAKKSFMNMDERNRSVANRVMSVMYLMTIVAMQGIVLYRQFILGQSYKDFEDIAIVMTVNSLFVVAGLLYFGAIPLQRIKIRSLLLIYALIVLLGSIFIYVKYMLIQSPALSPNAFLSKIGIVAAVSGLVVFFFVIFAWLGKRKMEKELEG